MRVTRYLILAAVAIALAAAEPRAIDALSPEQAASYCYDQAKKMGFTSRDMEDRSWEDCMGQFRRQAQPAAPSLTPEQRMLLRQQQLNQMGLEFGRAALRSSCNSQGGYYTPDGQCLRSTAPPLQLLAQLPSWQCQHV